MTRSLDAVPCWGLGGHLKTGHRGVGGELELKARMNGRLGESTASIKGKRVGVGYEGGCWSSFQIESLLGSLGLMHYRFDYTPFQILMHSCVRSTNSASCEAG